MVTVLVWLFFLPLELNLINLGWRQGLGSSRFEYGVSARTLHLSRIGLAARVGELEDVGDGVPSSMVPKSCSYVEDHGGRWPAGSSAWALRGRILAWRHGGFVVSEDSMALAVTSILRVARRETGQNVANVNVDGKTYWLKLEMFLQK